MRQLTSAETLALRELLQMETVGLAVAQASDQMIKEPELKTLSESGLQTAKARIAEMQRFIRDDHLIGEVQ